MGKQVILFDLEGVIYDNIRESFCNGFIKIYDFAEKNNIVVAVVTGADKQEILYINKKIPLINCFGTNIYSSKELGYEFKNSKFFGKVIEDLNTVPRNVCLVDDGEKNLIGAKKIGITTYYVNNEKSNYSDGYGSLLCFLSFYQNYKGINQ